MPKKITFNLSGKSTKKAYQELVEYISWYKRKTTELTERLALVGVAEASRRFGDAIYDGENDIQLTLKPIDNGWSIVAEGKAVCFIEFGTGVYHNPSEPYPGGRPPGVLQIGEYGQGKGKRQGWVFYGADGSAVFTRGNPAAMPMWYASERIQQEVLAIAREVFSTP